MSERMSERLQITTRIISAVLTLALAGGAFYLIVIDRSDQIPAWLAVCGLVGGGVAGVLPSAVGSLFGPKPNLNTRPPRRPPTGPITGAFLMLFAMGCGAGAIGAQADLIAVAGIATAGADEVLVGARARELDAIVDEARRDCAEGCSVDEADAYRARLREAEEHWAPVLACRAPVVEALRAWLDGLETAHAAATAELGIGLLVRLGMRFVAAYGGLRVCVTTAEPDVELPALPVELAPIGGVL